MTDPRQTALKQADVAYWIDQIKLSPSGKSRSIRNLRAKQSGGHPLSTSEHNLLEAARLTTGKWCDAARG